MHTIIPLLTLAASAGGSGWLATRLFAWLRMQIPKPTAAEWKAAPWLTQQGWALLHAPQQSRITVFVLAAVVAALASAILAALTGGDAFAVLDAALAVVVSQLLHGAGLPRTVAFDVPPQPEATPRPEA